MGQFAPGYFALKDVSLVDVDAGRVLPHYTIVVHNDIIEKVGPAKDMSLGDSVTVFNYPGKIVMPGLIDSHVHLATEPSKDDSRPRAERDLQDMLLSGITTVRDMAGDARALASLSRDAKLDLIVAPDIYYAALMAGPKFFSDPRTHQSTQGGIAGEMPFMRAVTDSTDIRQVVAEAKGTGASAIKLYAELSGNLAKKITTEAHRQHMRVWSHFNLTIASPLEVINAGVDVVSHSGMIVGGWMSRKIQSDWLKPGLTARFWDSAFNTLPVTDYINAMLANKTVLDATLLTFKNAATDSGIPANVRLRFFAGYEIAKRFTLLALKRGVPVSAGTDLDEKKFVQREIKLMAAEGGFTPMEAIISGTLNGARTIGIESTSGSIKPGKLANMIVLTADPTIDVQNLDKVFIVIKNGKFFRPANSEQ